MRKNRTAKLTVIAFLLMPVFLSACTGIKTPATAATAQQKNIVVSNSLQQMFTQSLAYLQEQEYDKAISLLEQLTEKEKRLAAPFVNLGIAYSRTGKTKKAEQNFITALRIDIAHPVANNELGLLYRKTGRFGAARTAYENALSMHPDYLPLRKNLGILCEIYLHDLPCAVEQFQAYLEYKPDETIIAGWALEIKQRIELKQQSQPR